MTIKAVAFETSSTGLGVALSMPRRTVFNQAPFQQAESIIPTLDGLLKKNKVKREDLELVVVDIGPGSFTGVRVGVSVARALGQALFLPVIGVCSLDAVMAQARRMHLASDEPLAACLPASEGELYYQIEGTSPAWGTYNEFQSRLRNGMCVVGPVQEKLSAFLENRLSLRWIPLKNTPHVDDILAIGLERFSLNPRKAFFPYSVVEPLYLQPSWAERKKKT